MKRFSRYFEDFLCENCGEYVVGDGFTDHCPQCLYSKHVDRNPGDRASECHGMMVPTGIEARGGEYIIMYRCERCGYERRNRAEKSDNFDAILKLATSPSGENP